VEKLLSFRGQASYTAAQLTRFGFLNIHISNGIPHTINRNFLYQQRWRGERSIYNWKRNTS